ncbi:MAG: filamentous hemagglutinin N-terminal domain-containing protein [Tildeniella nuda ZEHNDER 1965/U140]|jgi:filamentous hemagglutinin family protein|nr:filamentous hemagglutinin N-terminal domain-containing protein [Tildeniella nuda ZEHNDER 1965/U140]
MRLATSQINVLLTAAVLSSAIGVEQLQAQIVPNLGDTGTIVTPVGNRLDISGGTLSGDNSNLFHSLSQFGLTQSQIANFLSNPSTRNILVRVTGGEASRLDGLIQVSGSNANLFLMNPAGVVFGSSATLNVSGSFIATTANGIGFGANWFNASGINNYEVLSGNPSSYAFTVVQPGAVINAGNLAVGSGQQLALLGGTVVSSGGLSAPEGQIVVAAVPGQSIVRLSQPGALLSLEILRPTPADRVEAWTMPIPSLPELLTGGSGSNATGLTVNANGQAELTGSGVQVVPGDVAIRQSTAAIDGTLVRATGTSLGAAAFLQVPKPDPGNASRTLVPPPDEVLPPSSVRQSAPPDETLPRPALPSLVVPDCGPACPTTKPANVIPQSTQPAPSVGNTTGNSAPIVNFQINNQANTVVTLPEALPQYSSQTTANQPSPVQPVNTLLPIGDPEQNLSSGAIDELNHASAIALRLEELRNYLQKRWNASSPLGSKLQYRLLLDAKGAIQQVVPMDQNATIYLKHLSLAPASQSTERTVQGLEVIITLNPDGTVEVIPNSLTLRSMR